MEAISSSEKSAETQRATRRHIPEDDTPQNGVSSDGFNFNFTRTVYNEHIGYLEGRVRPSVYRLACLYSKLLADIDVQYFCSD
jgi:hypothetical protein